MGGLDQRLEIFGPPIGAVRREGQHAVVAPVALAGEVGKWHQLYRRNAMLAQVAEFRGGAGVSALRRESPDVQLVDHRLLPRPVVPARVLPRITAPVDHPAWPRAGLPLGAGCGGGPPPAALGTGLVHL